MTLQAAILDWAGTTVDFGCMAPVLVLKRIFAEQGIDLTTAEARHGMGLFKADQIRQILRLERVNAAWVRMHGAEPGESIVDLLYERFIPVQTECVVEHSDVIPGVPEAIALLRQRGLKIATTTGYTRAMLDPVMAKAAVQGYLPDYTVCPDEVPAGRPAPFMCWRALTELGVWPASAAVKIGDTPVDMEEGRNAGLWTIGVAATGNETGLSPAEFAALPASEREARVEQARVRLREAGAHVVIDHLTSITEALRALERFTPLAGYRTS